MAKVPTGWLGPETKEEDEAAIAQILMDQTGQRSSLPAGLRFKILKRDGYRCQLCGRSTIRDAVKLYVDHRIARANGGGDEDENLWTLCQDCNLGKGDKEW